MEAKLQIYTKSRMNFSPNKKNVRLFEDFKKITWNNFVIYTNQTITIQSQQKTPFCLT